LKSLLLSLGNVVHSDNDEESLYACCCTQKVTVKGCHKYSVVAVTVHRYLHKVQWSWFAIAGNGVNLINTLASSCFQGFSERNPHKRTWLCVGISLLLFKLRSKRQKTWQVF